MVMASNSRRKGTNAPFSAVIKEVKMEPNYWLGANASSFIQCFGTVRRVTGSAVSMQKYPCHKDSRLKQVKENNQGTIGLLG